METMFSVIIPVYNEENLLAQCIQSVRDVAPDVEIIVVDGGSQDQTLAVASENNVISTTAGKGRGPQLNAGAKLATGDILVFLHADTKLPKNAFSILKNNFCHSHIQIGTFRISFDHRHWLLDFYSRMTKVDSLWTRFGDQCIVIRKPFFDFLDGFPNWPLFEDVFLLQEARKLTKVHSFPAHVVTSSRRFIKNGIFRQQLKNGWFILQYVMGVPPEILEKKYHA